MEELLNYQRQPHPLVTNWLEACRNHFMGSKIFGVALTACFLGMVSLTISQAKENEVSQRQDKLNGGYYLLHHLCDEESQLPMLSFIKTTPPEIVEYVDRISKTSKESLASLERMQDHDPAIRFDKNPLPSIERDVRESIHDAKQHQLLFGTTDAAFVRALLVSQIEASTYAVHLSKVLAEQETDPVRAKALQRISAKWLLIQNETYRHLKG